MISAGDQAAGSPWGVLFILAERLGWIFKDRDQYRTVFPEPAPDEASGPAESTTHALPTESSAGRSLGKVERVA